MTLSTPTIIGYKPVVDSTSAEKAPSPQRKKASKIASESFNKLYEDTDTRGKPLSRTKVHYVPVPEPKMKFQKHKSLEALCKHIALKREPTLRDPKQGSFYKFFDNICCSIVHKRWYDRDKEDIKEKLSNPKYSAINRSDLKTEVYLHKRLKKKIGISKTPKGFFETEITYSHNSELNGHSYKDAHGKYHKIHSAISSSADREALTTQNLALVKTGGEKLLYTGRPDSFEKAKEEALFVLSHTAEIPLLKEASLSKANLSRSNKPPKWIEGKEGITWNEKTKCIEFSYAIYSVMTDSTVLSWVEKNRPKEDELFLLNGEIKALAELKKGPTLIQDENENVFEVQFKPIFFMQGFNSWAAFKGFSGEGHRSPPIMAQGWKELKKQKDFAEKTKGVAIHVRKLEEYFAGRTHLSNLHLFIHMHLVLSAININEELPLVLHCKSTIDRTGMGAAILTTLNQWKRLGKKIPEDLQELTDSEPFKELVRLNWLPIWNERARFSRDHEGICFGLGASRNPILLECLPKRCLKKSKSTARWIASGIVAAINTIGIRLKLLWISLEPLFYNHSEQELSDWYARKQYAYLQTKTTTYFPHMLFGENVAQYELSKHKTKKAH